MNKFTIVSGFTLKTPYETEVQLLKESLKKFSLNDEHIVGYENQGTWRKNCQYKALIIKSKLEELNSPVVWLDADAVLLSYPKLFEEIEEDIALAKYGEVMSGTLYFKPTRNVFSLLDEWIDENFKNPLTLDQSVLDRVLKRNDIKIKRLPFAYCDFIGLKNCVIAQNQASRRFRQLIDSKKSMTNDNVILAMKTPIVEKISSGLQIMQQEAAIDVPTLKENIRRFTPGWDGGMKDGTICGSGSTIKYTENVRKFIQTIVKKYNIKSISDAGCGDRHWMKLLDFSNIEYKGYDIVPRDKDVIFFDITSQILPQTDLIINRDVIWHLNEQMIASMINNFKKSNSKYLLINYFKHVDNSVLKGQFRRVSLMKEPYFFPEPIEEILENSSDKRFVGLWDLSSINYLS
jgi:hypothetical protein